ncbi:MAG: two pore domain potassium channel family protein [Acidobacteria bacterium]|nr:MAG: two pore domain potassium channel family protein [Acidobacteriota bacterium]
MKFRVPLFDGNRCKWIHVINTKRRGDQPQNAQFCAFRVPVPICRAKPRSSRGVEYSCTINRCIIILPRRVRRKFRLTRFFYRGTWRPWSAVAKRISSNDRRELLLSFYGPVSLLFLLSMWAAGLVLGFACLYRSLEIPIKMEDGGTGFLTYLYFSGSTFFTLGLGDVLARSWTGRLLTVLEAGMGLGFLAIVIGYLPVLYQAFSRRELNISLLDARAGSPSTAAELLRRHFDGDEFVELSAFLREWERWAAELLESHLSYPVLAYYRSQHTNQSWLGALTTILDATTLVMVGIDGTPAHQAQLTFAIARHAVADLSHVFNTKPQSPPKDRLPPEELGRMRSNLGRNGIFLQDGDAAVQKLNTLRRMYEPYVHALSEYLLMPLPSWEVALRSADNWQTSAWERIAHL